MAAKQSKFFTLVARKPSFGLPTACPDCLSVYFYLKFANIPFDLWVNSKFPDSEQIPYVESGDYVAFNNEKGGVIESLKEGGVVDLDSSFHNVSEWISMKAMISSWLRDALIYEVWVASESKIGLKIFYSDLPWPIGKFLSFKQVSTVKKLLGITKENAERRETEIYRRAGIAYGALSTRLGEDSLLFDRPTSVDTMFLGHALFILQALPETSVLRTKLLSYNNLVKYAENLSNELTDVGSSSTAPSSRSDPSSSTSKSGFGQWSSKPKSKPKRETTEEEKKFKRRGKYFLAAQFVSILVFLTLLGNMVADEVELEDEGNVGFDYHD